MQLGDTNFTQLDWVIVMIYLGSSILIGIWANRFVGNLSDYLVAGRTLRIRLALATMTGTELGLVTVMYSSQQGFTQHFAALYMAVIEGVSLLIVGLTGIVVFKLRASMVLTIPEYYEQRYSSGVRVLGGVMMVLAGVLNMGLFLRAGSEFLTAISGLEDALYLKWIMTALLCLVLFYTVLGGMVSVVITDLIQFLVLGVGMLVVTLYVLSSIGMGGLLDFAASAEAYVNPTRMTNPAVFEQAPAIGPLTILVQSVVIFTAIMLWPAGASRTLSVKSPETAQQLYLWSTVPFLARRALPMFWGLGAYIYFFHGGGSALADPLRTAFQEGHYSTLAAMPLFLAKIIPTGLLGIVTAGMVAAFMSTHDSYLLCWSGVVTQDVIAPLFGPLSQQRRIWITRIAILVIGVMLLIWGLWYELQGNLWDYMAITGTIYLAGVLPVVVAGLYWKPASTAGAYLALLGGVVGVLGLAEPVLWLQSNVVGWIEAGHMTLLAFAVSAAGMLIGSLLLPDPAGPPSANAT